MPEKTVKITNGKTLQQFLSAVIDESVKSALAQRALTEKEKQAATHAAVSNQSGGGGDEEDDSVDNLFGGNDNGGDGAEDAQSNMPDLPDEEDKQPSKTMDDETEKLKRGDVKVKDIVEKLNSIRSGKSFKDSAVSKAIDEYVNSLKKPERVALMAFLRGIAQIVTGEVPGQAAEEPSKHPADVQMQKTNEPKVVQKKPNVIKGPGGNASPAAPSGGAGSPKPASKEPEEDTTPPAPIVPKRRK